MIKCTHCGGQSTLFLDQPCIDMLDEMLEQLPWLLYQLNITRTCQDRLTIGAVGHGANPSPIRIGAMELARDAETTLLGWVETLCQTGLTSPASGPVQHAWWLSRHLDDIARIAVAGDFFDMVADLVGDPDHPDTRPGKIVTAINRNERLFCGPCPTVLGHDREGLVIECSTSLFANDQQQSVTCPRCEYEIDVQRNRSRCAVDRDLATEAKLLSLLADLGETVPRMTFYKWLKENKIHVRGWMHQGQIVPHKVRHSDPRVFSISQVRILRSQELQEKVAV